MMMMNLLTYHKNILVKAIVILQFTKTDEKRWTGSVFNPKTCSVVLVWRAHMICRDQDRRGGTKFALTQQQSGIKHWVTKLYSFKLILKVPVEDRPLGLLSASSGNSEFKKWRRQRGQRRHKSMIWLVEWGKIIVLHVQQDFWCNFLT